MDEEGNSFGRNNYIYVIFIFFTARPAYTLRGKFKVAGTEGRRLGLAWVSHRCSEKSCARVLYQPLRLRCDRSVDTGFA